MLMFVYHLIDVYTWVICIYVLLSWFPGIQQNEIARQLYVVMGQIVEPLLELIRSALPKTSLDFSPVVAILALTVISRLLLRL